MRRKRLSLAERRHKELRSFAGAPLRRFLVNADQNIIFRYGTGSSDERRVIGEAGCSVRKRPGLLASEVRSDNNGCDGSYYRANRSSKVFENLIHHARGNRDNDQQLSLKDFKGRFHHPFLQCLKALRTGL